jgi:hypothetical protein
MDSYHSIEKYVKKKCKGHVASLRSSCYGSDSDVLAVIADFINEFSDPLLFEHYLEQRSNGKVDIKECFQCLKHD